MLFSDDRIVRLINESFEPAWESVRAVPTVHIDFGDKSITRTLHGNIATYVCTGEGKVLDVLPGAYEPQTYLTQLDQLKLLHQWITLADPVERLAHYHNTQFQALEAGTPPPVLGLAIADFSKVARIEGPLELALMPGRKQAKAVTTSANTADSTIDALMKDTQFNETVRRRSIHQHLAKLGFVATGDITKWLYREVLDNDLDDPYLGLGETLFANYPFQHEG